MGIEFFERAAEARGRFLKAEQLQQVGGSPDPQRGPGYLLTFDVGRILVVADPNQDALLVREVASLAEVESIDMAELVEEEPWWRIAGDSLTAVWPGDMGGGASRWTGPAREVRLQFRETTENPKIIVLGYKGGEVRVFEEKVSSGRAESG